MGYILALTTIFLWSWNIIIASSFATKLAPFEIAFGRWLVAGLILIPIAWGQLKKHKDVLLKNWLLILGLSLTGIVIDNTLIYFAGQTTSAINISLLGSIGPIFIVIFSKVFFKTQITPQQVVGLIITFIGVLAIVLKGDFSQFSQVKMSRGDIYIFLNTIGFAIYTILQGKQPREVPQTALLAASVIVGIPILAILNFAFVSPSQLSSFNLEDFKVIVYLGIFNSVIAYLAWNTAIAKIGAVKTGIIFYLLPIFSIVEAHFFLAEQISQQQVLYGIIVILGVMLVNLQKPLHKK